jgi:hypothetical protein
MIKNRRGNASGAFDALLRPNQNHARALSSINTPLTVQHSEGYCLIIKKNKKLTKRFLYLEGTDLYCYKEKDKKTKLFYHTLVGTLLSALDSEKITVS